MIANMALGVAIPAVAIAVAIALVQLVIWLEKRQWRTLRLVVQAIAMIYGFCLFLGFVWLVAIQS